MADVSLEAQVGAVRQARARRSGSRNPALEEAESTLTRLRDLRARVLAHTDGDEDALSDHFSAELLGILKIDSACS